jgi:sugar phosphate isomerase/epimerase
VPSPHFSLSTYLYRGERLGRDRLREIRGAGFETIELFATRAQVDYHHDPATADFQQWLADAGLTLESVHAPTSEHWPPGGSGTPLNLASPDGALRAHALEEVMRALQIARRLWFSTFVVHAGEVRTPRSPAGDNSRDGARRSIEALAEAADPLGVRVAVEVIANELSKPAPLVHFIEDVLEAGAVSICLDLGHAHLEGDLMDAIETVSEHLSLVHAHDNRGRRDDHLLPFEGTIDWPGAMVALQKVGYEGAIVLEPGAREPQRETLARARAARRRLEQLLTTL